MSSLDVKNLYITRKRKKWKFAHFNSYANCFEHLRGEDSQEVTAQLKRYFKKSQPIILEIAAGNAQFSLQLAKLHPEFNFIAVDIKSDRLYTSGKQALEEGITNIAFLRMHLNELEKTFAKNSISTIWLTFPDPYPRKRSAKHRLTHPSFLQQYQTILAKDGRLKFKTDNRELFLWSLEQFVTDKWKLNELSFDLHESDLSHEYKIPTYYEQKFTSQGIPINYCSISL